jgi:hypothetical protein
MGQIANVEYVVNAINNKKPGSLILPSHKRQIANVEMLMKTIDKVNDLNEFNHITSKQIIDKAFVNDIVDKYLYDKANWVAFVGGAGVTSDIAAYSLNGKKWYAASRMPASRTWSDVSYGDGKFIATAQGNNNGAYTTDCINWYPITLPTPTNSTYGSIRFGYSSNGDKSWVATKYATANCINSRDGSTWSDRTMPNTRNWTSVGYGNKRFVMVASGSDRGAYSNNGGDSWTEMTMPGTSADWTSVFWGNGIWVAAVTGTTNFAGYSYDGITWQRSSFSSSRRRERVCFGNGCFIIACYGSNVCYRSTDGINWTEITLPGANANWRYVSFGNGIFVIIAYGSNRAVWSEDGINWTEITLPSSANWYSIDSREEPKL